MTMPDFSSFAEQGDFIPQIQRRIGDGSLPHALLITGEKGVGKKTLAQVIAAALLCQHPSSRPCGECPACRQVASGNHPDLIVIQKGTSITEEKEDKSKTVIPVSEIAELERRCAALPYEGDRRVAIIRDADDMNPEAQNKLLKTLEDPPGGNFFLLTSAKRENLLPTIVSRCESVYLHPWRQDTILRVLRAQGIDGPRAKDAAGESGGSIGAALQLAVDENYWKTRSEVYRQFFHMKASSEVLSVSNQWKDRREEAELLFSLLEGGIHRLLHYRLHSGSGEANIEEMFGDAWLRFARECDLEDFTRLTDGIILARKRLQASVNFQVIVEQILFMMMEASRKWST